MSVELISKTTKQSKPVYLLSSQTKSWETLPKPVSNWIKATNFSGKAGELQLIGDQDQQLYGAVFGIGDLANYDPFVAAKLTRHLPEGEWYFATGLLQPELFCLGLLLGDYCFDAFKAQPKKSLRFVMSENFDQPRLKAIYDAVKLARDLINMPTNSMGPDALEKAVRGVGHKYAATVTSIKGDNLLRQNFPLIHAVGRAGSIAPRLIDLTWGRKDAPKVTLVGKGVCFDTGGLDIKSAAGMLLMKKDMGGAANALALAQLIMSQGLDVRLRLLIPAVENAIAGNAFRPGDIIKSRKGLSVEIGNTDAEGRLVLADALTLADEESPELLLDLATLTGAARVALGPDLPPFYCDDSTFVHQLMAQAKAQHDPLWHMPLWRSYDHKISSRIADLNNTSSDGFAGSIMAALFLQNFVEKAQLWAHFDIYGWNPTAKATNFVGGEAQAIRALYAVIEQKYGKQNGKA